MRANSGGVSERNFDLTSKVSFTWVYVRWVPGREPRLEGEPSGSVPLVGVKVGSPRGALSFLGDGGMTAAQRMQRYKDRKFTPAST